MSTPAPTPELYRAKIWRNQGGGLYFTLVYRPACRLAFRLLLPYSVLTYPELATLHLQAYLRNERPRVGKFFHIACGCEHYPAAPVLRIES